MGGNERGGYKTGVCTKGGFGTFYYWKYSPCEPIKNRVKCETKFIGMGTVKIKDPVTGNWGDEIITGYCERPLFDKIGCTKEDGSHGKRLCLRVEKYENICTNIGRYGDECFSDGLVMMYGPAGRRDYSSLQNVTCLNSSDCVKAGGADFYACDADLSSVSALGHCYSDLFRKACMIKYASPTSCTGSYAKVGENNVLCGWNYEINKCDEL